MSGIHMYIQEKKKGKKKSHNINFPPRWITEACNDLQNNNSICHDSSRWYFFDCLMIFR